MRNAIISLFGSYMGQSILNSINYLTGRRVRFTSRVRANGHGLYEWQICVNGHCFETLLNEEEVQRVLGMTEFRFRQISNMYVNINNVNDTANGRSFAGQLSW